MVSSRLKTIAQVTVIYLISSTEITFLADLQFPVSERPIPGKVAGSNNTV